MLRNTKIPTGGLLLAGLAAFAYYKYSKMSEEEKKDLVNNVKDKGQKLYDQYVPEDIKNMIGKKGNTTSSANSFDEANSYTV